MGARQSQATDEAADAEGRDSREQHSDAAGAAPGTAGEGTDPADGSDTSSADRVYQYTAPAPRPIAGGKRMVEQTLFLIPLHVTLDPMADARVAVTPLEGTDVIQRIRDIHSRSGSCSILYKLELVNAYNPLPVDLTFTLRGLQPSAHRDCDFTLPKFATGDYPTELLYRHRCDVNTLRNFGNLRLADLDVTEGPLQSPYTHTGTYRGGRTAPSLHVYRQSPRAASRGSDRDTPTREVSTSSTAGSSDSSNGNAGDVDSGSDAEHDPHLTRINTDLFLYNFIVSKGASVLQKPVTIVPISRESVMVSTHTIQEARQFIYDKMIRHVTYVNDLRLTLAWKRSEDDLQTIQDALEDEVTAKPIVLIAGIRVTYVYCDKIIYI